MKRPHARRSPAPPMLRGLSLIDVAIILIIIALLLAMILPSISKSRDEGMTFQSMFNLRMLHVAHRMYGADHNGNQWTIIPHDLAEYGHDLASAIKGYNVSVGDPGGFQGKGFYVYPQGYGVTAGTACTDLTGCTSWIVVSSTLPLPMSLAGPHFGGHFRLFQLPSFNTYVDGRFYDATFYAPKDTIPIVDAGACFDSPDEFCVDFDTQIFVSLSSYALSPAAMFDPAMWSVADGSFPLSNSEVFTNWPTAFKSPEFTQIRYPDLKSHMIEHHWLQNFPGPQECHPDLSTATVCAPYRFTHSARSEPATLFYDGHIRLLPNSEVQHHEQRVELWRRDTAFGTDGYQLQFAHDQIVDVSHHILTKDGAHGRDTLGPIPTSTLR